MQSSVFKMSVIVGLLSAGCSAQSAGPSDGGLTETQGAEGGACAPARCAEDSGATPDAARPGTGAVDVDAGAADAGHDAAPADAGSSQEDLSLCGADALVFTQRAQLTRYGARYTDADATRENFPVSQYRPDFGVPGWGAAFKDNTIAIRVRVPASYPVVHPDHLGFIRVAEAPGQPVTFHQVCVSAHACDFSRCIADGDTAPGINFTVGNPGGGGATPDFTPDQIFWINLRNVSAAGGPSCPPENQSCGILVDFASPNRY